MEKYWASEGLEKIGANIIDKFEDYQEYLNSTGLLYLWQNSFDTYYKPAFMLGKVQKGGAQGEYALTCVNHYKNLLQHILNMVTQNRPALDPIATNTDQVSQSQTMLSRGLLDYYLKEKDLESDYVLGIDYCLKLGEGFVIKEWDAKEGEIISQDPETGETQNEGDLVFSSALPNNVARDVSIRDIKKNKWYIVRRFENKFDMAARYPELAEKIMGLSYQLKSSKYELLNNFEYYKYESDLVPVYRMYHEATPALPEGRITECLREDIVTLDGPMPYKRNPVKRIISAPIDGLNFGYSVAFDMLPIQEQSDIAHSIIKTNQRLFGVQNVQAPQGSNVSVTELKDGLNLIQFDPKLGKLEPLNLLFTPPEIFSYVKDLSVLMETMSGVNSVARGNPEASLKTASGSAMALIQSMAIQFSNKLEQSATKVLEEIGTDIINDIRMFQQNQRTKTIVGESNKAYVKDFTAKDLDMVNRVTVSRGSPLGKTVAGKLQIAQDLFEKGLIKTPEQYYQVLVTGKVEVAAEGAQAELLNIKAENEALSDGRQVPVMITDNHLQHINEHKFVVASPEARQNPMILKTVLDHIQDHINKLSDPMNANILSLMGQQPVMPPPSPVPDAPPPGDMNGPQGEGPEGVNMPLAPQNPMTGERVELAPGSEGRQEPLS